MLILEDTLAFVEPSSSLWLTTTRTTRTTTTSWEPGFPVWNSTTQLCKQNTPRRIQRRLPDISHTWSSFVKIVAWFLVSLSLSLSRFFATTLSIGHCPPFGRAKRPREKSSFRWIEVPLVCPFVLQWVFGDDDHHDNHNNDAIRQRRKRQSSRKCCRLQQQQQQQDRGK